MKGSCLCGKCTFEISEPYGSINKCHCTKCRKVSGTGSNAVLWIEPSCLNWCTGKELIKTFTMPDGRKSVFCGVCGSPLPRYIQDEEWIVPAGILDEDLEAPIRQHIFVENKPPWEIICDDAPQYLKAPKNGNT